MSRARDNANLGAQAGSGLDASDITSGVLPVGVTGGSGLDPPLFLENTATTQNLSGTYSTERLYFNDSYQLTGNVTITGHLALGTVADADVVITQDSTERTITGSGTLEAGELLSSKEIDLTGMTGELGSAVTGSPNLNLGNATFPAGMIINTYFAQQTGNISQSNSTPTIIPGLTISAAAASSSNKFLIQFHGGGYIDSGDDTVFTWRIFGNNAYIGHATGSTDGEATTAVYNVGGNNVPTGSISGSLLYSPNTTSSISFDLRVFLGYGSGSFWHPEPSGQLIIFEIQG